MSSLQKQELQNVAGGAKECLEVKDSAVKRIWARLKSWLVRVLHDDRSFEDRHW
jgi:hypothetical protein